MPYESDPGGGNVRLQLAGKERIIRGIPIYYSIKNNTVKNRQEHSNKIKNDFLRIINSK
jgi:hypothetical protein